MAKKKKTKKTEHENEPERTAELYTFVGDDGRKHVALMTPEMAETIDARKKDK